MKGPLLALGFLTRLPAPRVEASREEWAAAIRWYPLAGLAVGAVVTLARTAGAWVDPWTGALAGLAAWVLVTGALHLDGLADVADGVGAAHGDPNRLIEVMADPRVGGFGVVAIVVQLLAKLVLLHAAAVAPWWAIALVPATARIGPLAWARWAPPLGRGLGAAVARAARVRDAVGWAALVAAAAVAAPALLAAVPLIAGWGWWLRRRLGGVNGDAHGAGIELVETGLLLALAVARRL